MATMSIDYDSNGDVELILEDNKESPPLRQATQEALQSSQHEDLVKYNVGPLGVNVKEVRLRVSSLKLISSSQYFKGMLEGSVFPEGRELQEQGFIRIELLEPEDDPTAMMIVLGILYGTDIQVPVRLDVPMLHKVAILVDKYRWHALVTPHAISWVEEILHSQSSPSTVDENLLMLLFITWLFGIKDHFKTLSRIAQQDGCKSIDLTDEGVRLPTRALKAINEQRDIAFQEVEQTLETLQSQLLDRTTQNEDSTPEHQMVRCMALGFTIFCAQDLQLGQFAAPDHAGNSVRALETRINLLQSMEGFVLKSRGGDRRRVQSGGDWDLKHKLMTTIIDLKIDEWGLNYDDFKGGVPS